MDAKLLPTDLLKKDRLSLKVWMLIVVGLLYQVFYIFQGLDFTDTGFHMTSYQQIFDHPETVHYSFMFWLSNVVGGLLMKISPSLIFNRLVSVALHSAMFWLYYNLNRRFSTRDKAAIYTLLGLIFFQYYGFETLNYDSFTVASMSLSIYFIIIGLWSNGLRLMLIGVFVCGVSTYFRITNMGYIILLPLTLHFYHLENKDTKKTVMLALSMSFLYVLGHFLIFLIMSSMGHWDLFVSNLAFVKTMGRAENSSHGLLPVMLLYGKGLVKISFVILILAGVYFLVPTVKRFISFDILKGMMLFGVGFFMFFTYQYPEWAWNKLRYVLYAAVFINTVYCLRVKNQHLTILAVFAFVLMFVFPLGSDSGIAKLYFSSGLSLTVLMYSIDHVLIGDYWVQFKITIVSFYMFICICFGLSNTYFDLGSRRYKTVSIDHPYLSYIYTTPERSTDISLLLSELKVHTKVGDYLLAFSDIPMVNFLTNTLPFIKTSWPKLYYDPDIFNDKLHKAQQRYGNPIIVIQKMEMRSNWPQQSNPDYLDLSKTVSGIHPVNRLPEHYRFMFNYLNENQYQKIWENKTFIIFKSA